MRIIPAIDLIDGKCVRLTQGNYHQKTIYHENPLEMAKFFEDNGFKYLHLVDLEGAKNQRVIHYKVLEAICTHTQLLVDFSGGIKTHEDLKKVLNSGANQACIGSLAAKNPVLFTEWLLEFGQNKIVLSADFQEDKILIQGWLEKTEWNLLDYLQQFISFNLKYVICTDISKDGTLNGPNFEVYRNIIKCFQNLKLIASGGVHDETDIKTLHEIGCDGVIIGKALYEGKINLNNLLNYA